MSLQLFNVYMGSVIKEVKMEMGRRGESGDCLTCGLFCSDESEEDLRAMVGCFVGVYRRRSLKENASKSKMKVLGEKEGLECEVCVELMRLEHVSEFKYRNLNIGRWRVGEGLQEVLGLCLMLGVCS